LLGTLIIIILKNEKVILRRCPKSQELFRHILIFDILPVNYHENGFYVLPRQGNDCAHFSKMKYEPAQMNFSLFQKMLPTKELLSGHGVFETKCW
jgi:hypothetical protein